MNKEQLDELYHNLRELCITDDLIQKEAVAGIVSHLTEPKGDYRGLLRFLSYYGEEYILPDAIKLLKASSPRLFSFSRVVELGAGFAWLGRGISDAFGQLPTVFIDKRQYVFTDVVADFETIQGSKRVLDVLKEGDLIVMSELLHCLDDPQKTLRPFTKWPMLVVEYMPLSAAYHDSYNTQIQKFDCKPVENIGDVFPGSVIRTVAVDPYMMWLVLPL